MKIKAILLIGFLILTTMLQAQEKIRATLYVYEMGQPVIADGVLVEYGNYSDSLDAHDARKMINPEINFSIFRFGTNLVVERRRTIVDADTIPFKMWNTPKGDYILKIVSKLSQDQSKRVFIKDFYLGNEIEISPLDTTVIPFAINTDPASLNPFRFQLFIVPDPPTPIAREAEESIRIYPNPVQSEKITFSLTSTTAQTYQVKIVDMRGVMIFVQNLQVDRGTGLYSLAFPGRLVNGLYKIQLSAPGKRNIINTFSVISQ